MPNIEYVEKSLEEFTAWNLKFLIDTTNKGKHRVEESASSV